MEIDLVFAEAFAESLLAGIDRIRRFPESGRIVPEMSNIRIREIFLKKYRLFYFIKTETTVQVLSIVHMNRNVG